MPRVDLHAPCRMSLRCPDAGVTVSTVNGTGREESEVRDPEEVWRLGFRLYDVGMAAAEALRPAGAVREQAARLRALATTATPALAMELRELAEALEAELRADTWDTLAEAEELVGTLWAGGEGGTPEERTRHEELVLERLASLRRGDPRHDRPLGVLEEWVRLRGRRGPGPASAPQGVIPAP